MKRRTILKRLGAAGAGMAAVAGSANATVASVDGTDIDEVPLDGPVVFENGSVYVYSADTDPVETTDECCSCDTNGATDCDSSCDCCEFCNIV